MAGETIPTFTPQGMRELKRMFEDYRAGRLTNPPRGFGGGSGGGSMRLAKVVTAEIAAQSEGDAQLQEEGWTDSVEAVIAVRNDHIVPLPVGTRLYVQVIQNKWRVVIPFVECEPEEEPPPEE